MTMPIKTYYRSEMSVSSNKSFSPSAGKPAEFIKRASQEGIIEIHTFTPATQKNLEAAHSSEYITGVMSGKIPNGFGNRSAEIAQACLHTVGSMIAAAREAATTGSITCSPSSGFHHAGWQRSGGFCTFNGLVAAAATQVQENPKARVAILDCDHHFGDGTADILRRNSIEYDRIMHFTAGEHFVAGDDPGLFFNWLEMTITRINRAGCSLVIYQAGGDQHADDPLGGLLTTEEMIERDRMVFNGIRSGIAWNLAGGYQRDPDGGIDKIITLHMNTLREALNAQEARA